MTFIGHFVDTVFSLFFKPQFSCILEPKGYQKYPQIEPKWLQNPISRAFSNCSSKMYRFFILFLLCPDTLMCLKHNKYCIGTTFSLVMIAPEPPRKNFKNNTKNHQKSMKNWTQKPSKQSFKNMTRKINRKSQKILKIWSQRDPRGRPKSGQRSKGCHPVAPRDPKWPPDHPQEPPGALTSLVLGGFLVNFGQIFMVFHDCFYNFSSESAHDFEKIFHACFYTLSPESARLISVTLFHVSQSIAFGVVMIRVQEWANQLWTGGSTWQLQPQCIMNITMVTNSVADVNHRRCNGHGGGEAGGKWIKKEHIFCWHRRHVFEGSESP